MTLRKTLLAFKLFPVACFYAAVFTLSGQWVGPLRLTKAWAGSEKYE